MKRLAALLVFGTLTALVFWSVGAFLVGAALGWLLIGQQEMEKRLQQQEKTIEWLKVTLRRVVEVAAERDTSRPTAEADAVLPVPVITPPPLPVTPGPQLDSDPLPKREAKSRIEPEEANTREWDKQADHASLPRASGFDGDAQKSESSDVSRWIGEALNHARNWITGGNPFVRLGVVVLFVAFAFLVSLAVERAVFPIELRLAATAAAGLVLVGLGWRMRERSAGFGLTLQGGGSALFYLTIFAAYQLYALIPSGAAFGLLVLTTGLCALLALLQGAQTLALLALVGGFAAPIFGAGPEESALALFSYYGVLNLGVLVLAWYRPWRMVHVAGFLATFGLGGLWMSQRYTDALYPGAQAFLVGFFAIYFAVSFFHLRHQSDTPGERRRDLLLDSTLVIGLPIAAFSVQATLVAPFAYGLAWSALLLGLIYVAAAWVVYHRSPERLRLLVETYAGLGLVFATLVIPFALDATWTGVGWAVEGAALVWFGARQRRVLLRLVGVVLQLAAAVSLIDGVWFVFANASMQPHATYFAGLVLSFAALVTAWVAHYYRDRLSTLERIVEPLFVTLGMIWWTLSHLDQINQMASGDRFDALLVGLIALTGALTTAAAWRLDWPGLRRVALLMLPLSVAVLIVALWNDTSHLFAQGGWIAWIAAFGVLVASLWAFDAPLRDHVRGRLLHAGTLWLLAVLVAIEVSWHVPLSPFASVWPNLPTGLVSVVLALATLAAARAGFWPFGTWSRAYVGWGVGGLLVLAAVWGTGMASWSADPSPLPYLPLANPVDLTLGLGIAALVITLRMARRREMLSPVDVRKVGGFAVALVFVWLNATVARSVHFYAGVAYDVDALMSSSTFQSAVTIFWSAVGVITMTIAARKSSRPVWQASAILLGLAVLKLFLVDLANLSLLVRIGTFLVVGVFLISVGYLAPAPPKQGVPELGESEAAEVDS